MKAKYTFTVFTPTYDRRHTLPRVYEGLLSQTFKDFEWLIVDDGSSDGTRELVSGWIKEGKIPIRYFYQENSGKHMAVNRGVCEAEGELFTIIDSDDAFVPNALERFLYHWRNLPESVREQFCGVSGLCIDGHHNIVGKKYPADCFDSNHLDVRYKYGIISERCGFTRTRIMKEYPFPEVPNSSFVPESIVWNGIARQYKTRFINEPLRIYYSDDSPRTRQLTKSKDFGKIAKVLALWHEKILNVEIDYFFLSSKEFFRSATHYVRFSYHEGVAIKNQYRHLTNPIARCLFLFMLVPGYTIYLKDKVKR